MPRVANAPRAKHLSATTPRKQGQHNPLQVPLNDDKEEKAARLQSRQALHDLQLNSLKAAASPVRKLNNYHRAASDSPKTPRGQPTKGKENAEDGGLSVTAVNAMTPMKRVPILANFEEWMKMATDNKINAANSWNFALIDYFHDMSLLKEGDGVNFQKASCTLDGCVKIYTSRVDSVATETGKLLSGLADSGNKKSKGADGEESGDREEDDGGEDEDESGGKKKSRKRAQRSSEATLAPSFASLQLKKMELEFSVDPLFKKVAADFDEGGAKGLLLNHLAIDANGRIVFDSSDDIEDAAPGAENNQHEEAEIPNQTEKDDSMMSNRDDSAQNRDVKVDIASLGARFFPDLAKLDGQDICPTLKDFDLGDPSSSMGIPFLKAPDDWRQEKKPTQSDTFGDQTGVFLDDDDAAGFEDDGVLGGFDAGADAGFGEGGEAWAANAVLEPQTNIQEVGFEERRAGDAANEGVGMVGIGEFEPGNQQYGVSIYHKKTESEHENILNYFDNALQKNWAGPEHWRIRRIKDLSRPSGAAPAKRKEKEPFEINFNAPLDSTLAEMLYAPVASNSAISLPKTQWKSRTRNLLPDDKHFNSRQLLSLFLKPRARMGARRRGFGSQTVGRTGQNEELNAEMDEAFWARKENDANRGSQGVDNDGPAGNYDANFFQDDGHGFGDGLPDDEDEFADAREALSPECSEKPLDAGHESGETATGTAGIQEGAFGTQLVTQSRRLRPEYVQYARTAKKVDVRKLKEEMWKGIGFEEDPPKTSEVISKSIDETPPLKFTSVMNNLQGVYPSEAMADISTSYCFICLLHLANEKGLTLQSEPGLDELHIRRDLNAEIVEVDA